MSAAVFANEFRLRYLATSGGWLGSLVIWIANVTGMWDPLVTSLIAIISYNVVRTSHPTTAVLLALYFDGAIPAQYFFQAGTFPAHQSHLADYWPIFIVASALEGLGWLLLSPGGTTLVVCLKTIATTWIWIGRRRDGVFLSTAIRHGRNARPSVIPVGGFDYVPNQWAFSTQPMPSYAHAPAGTVQSSFGPAAAPAAYPPTVYAPLAYTAPIPTSMPAATAPPATPAPVLVDRDRLVEQGFTDPDALDYMMDHLSTLDEAEKQDKITKWLALEGNKLAKTMKEYARRRKAEVETGPAPPPPQDPWDNLQPPPYTHKGKGGNMWRHGNARKELSRKYPDRWTRWGMLDEFENMDADAADRALVEWKREPYDAGKAERWAARARHEAIRRRAEQLEDKAAKVGTLPPWSDPLGADTRLAPLHPEPISRLGMTHYIYSLDRQQALATLQRWETDVGGAAGRTSKYAINGQRVQAWQNELPAYHGPCPNDSQSDGWNRRLQAAGVYNLARLRLGMLRQLKHFESDAERGISRWLNETISDGPAMSARLKKYEGVGHASIGLYAGCKASSARGSALDATTLGMIMGQKGWATLPWLEQDRIREVLGRARSPEEEEAVAALLKDARMDKLSLPPHLSSVE